MNATNAVRQAWMTASEYSDNCLRELLLTLNLDKSEPGWREALAPFACVWAAMINASATDYHTASEGGVVDGNLASMQTMQVTRDLDLEP